MITSSSVVRETDMAEHVRAWFAERQLTAYPELSVYGGPVDMVGVSGELVVAVEMKMTWQQSLRSKLSENEAWANEVWFWCAGRPTEPTLDICRGRGWGVMSSACGQLLPAALWRHGRSRRRDILFGKLARHDQSRVAGSPTLKGLGPRQQCAARIRDYMASHPLARSREVFANVPNHYASFASFSGVFGAMIKDLRASQRG